MDGGSSWNEVKHTLPRPYNPVEVAYPYEYHYHPNLPDTSGPGPNLFEQMHSALRKDPKMGPYGPFKSREEAGFAKILVDSGLSLQKTDDLLKSAMVSIKYAPLQPSYSHLLDPGQPPPPYVQLCPKVQANCL
jgi:hypothetical protein